MASKELNDFIEGRRKTGYPDFRIKLNGCKNGRTGSKLDEEFTLKYTDTESKRSNENIISVRGKVI